MTLKKVRIINVFFVFLLSFLWHFIYDWFPNNLTALIFPVNESIWEHMKIIYYTIILGSLFENFLCHKFNISKNNWAVELATKPILGIIFYLIIFVPIYLLTGENMVFAISLMFIPYALMEVIGQKISMAKECNITILPMIIVVLGFFLFILLTFYPPHKFLFFDFLKLGYGILN